MFVTFFFLVTQLVGSTSHISLLYSQVRYSDYFFNLDPRHFLTMYTNIIIVFFFIASITYYSFCFFFIPISLKFGCLAVLKMIYILLWCFFMIIYPDIQSSVSIPIVIFISLWCSCTDISLLYYRLSVSL